MPKLLLLMALAATPFWHTKQPAAWSEEELMEFFTSSPWCQPAEAATSNRATGSVVTFLATAKPVQIAELESRRRKLPRDAAGDPSWEEFREFLDRDSGKYIVLAVAIPSAATSDASEMSTMETDSVLRAGKRKVKMSGYFPPSASDPFTRLIFPRAGLEDAKELVFDLFIPGTGTPYRQTYYKVKEMTYRGKVEM